MSMSTDRELLRAFKSLTRQQRAAVIDAMGRSNGGDNKPELITDSQLAEKLGMALVTLRLHLRVGPPKKKFKSGYDLRVIPQVRIGKKRYFRMSDVDRFIEGRLK